MPENISDNIKKATLPESVKQIGAIENDLRIYMEDYVYTYINQYARTNGAKEKLGILLGNHILSEGKNAIIINGFIQAKNTNSERGSESFTNESWSYIKEAKDKYFPQEEILGWVHTQPNFGAFLMGKDESYHNNYFPNDHQVLYILDPAEKIDTFYIRNRESDRLCAAKGYFIYYDTNEVMQTYMEDNRLTRPKEARFTPTDTENKKSSLLPFIKPKAVAEENIGDPASVGRSRLKKRSSGEANKRKLAILGSVSGILCLSCIMICLNIMNHSERISNLEAELNSGNILTSNSTATVFASQSENETPSSPLSPATSSLAEAEEEIVYVNDTEPVKTSSIPEYYVVEKGDSLSYISRKFYGDDSMITAIMVENGIENSDRIFYGRKIKLPNS